jgi:hypothetical protein
MMTSSIVLLHDIARLHTSTAAHTRVLLEHFNWELFDYPHYSPDLSRSDSHLCTYMKNLLGFHCFKNNENFMECVKTWLCSMTAQASFTQAYRNLFPGTSASIVVVTMSISSLSMYFFLYVMSFVHCLFCQQLIRSYFPCNPNMSWHLSKSQRCIS